jgi:nucleotide-binding universal stress UspA family protein
MKTIIAAVDNGLAAKPVLSAATALGELLDADVQALHARVEDAPGPWSLSTAASVPLRVVDGDAVNVVSDAGGADDVVAVVLGSRGIPSDPRPLGGTAEAVAKTLSKPVLVVAPDADPPSAFRRVLVPLEGSISSSLAPRSLIELARDTSIEIAVVHVMAADAIPAFTDQPQHEQAAWAREFLERYCPSGIEVVRFEVRVGRGEDVIPAVAKEWGCDLIALGWSQELSAGRAPVVRGALQSSHVPVLLVPVRVGAHATEGQFAMIEQ